MSAPCDPVPATPVAHESRQRSPIESHNIKSTGVYIHQSGRLWFKWFQQ